MRWKARYHFDDKEYQYWNPPLHITGITDIKEIGYRTNMHRSRAATALGTAMISDGVPRQIIYQVQQSLGFAGASIGVEMCVVGLNRNFAYSPRQRAKASSSTASPCERKGAPDLSVKAGGAQKSCVLFAPSLENSVFPRLKALQCDCIPLSAAALLFFFACVGGAIAWGRLRAVAKGDF